LNNDQKVNRDKRDKSVGAKERRIRHKQALRSSILSAARRLFVEQGYERVTIRQIANEIEYTPGIIYTHFADKQELFKSLCREIYSELGAIADPIARGAGSPLERLRRGLQAYFHFGLTNPELYRLAFIMEAPVDPADSPMQADAPAGQLFNQFTELVGEGIRQGEIRRVDPQAAAQTLWAAVHGLTSLLVTDQNFPWLQPEVLIDTLLETLVEGLRSRGAKDNGRRGR
jgi:AcrR family transcriptional regulator